MIAAAHLGSLASSECLDPGMAALFLSGALTDAEARDVETHVDRCARCREHLSELVRSGSGLSGHSGEDRPTASSESDGPRIAPGTRIGRFVLEAPLGAGAMGIVWAARDADLGRRVALKMLRGDVSSDEDHQNRLLREARAMARLAHPNVVTVYDLVIVERRLVLALELVEGESLTSWLASEKRAWRSTLHAFLEAGKGLAAAHAVGLVHRDFKPDNVLCDRQGRIAVTDFGLARLNADATAPRRALSLSPTGTLPMPAMSIAMTEPGALVGTPRYMAPEQIQGRAADARSDQWSFCVALFEALYGEHPFAPPGARAGAAALFDAVCAGGEPVLPRRSSVPSWIRRVLVRGLRAAPEARYRSMDDLLRALSADPRRRWRRTAGVLGAAGAVALTVLLTRPPRAESAPGPSCAPADQKLAGVWDDATKERARRAFQGTGKAQAASAFASVDAALDGYAKEWTTAAGAACIAAHGPGGLEPAKQQAVTCLDNRLTELRALTGVLEHADASVVANAIAASHSLVPVTSCRDPKPLGLPPKPPDPRLALRVSELRGELANVTALLETHKLTDAKTRAASLVEDAHATGYAPIEAEALLADAQVLKAVAEGDKMEPLLYRAAWLADGAGDDKTRAIAWLRLFGYLGMNVGEKEKPDLVIVRQQAMAAYARCRGPGGSRAEDELAIEYLSALTDAALGPGHYEEARTHTTAMASLVEKTYGEGHWRYATALDSLAKMNLLLGDYEPALGLLNRARGVLERAGATSTPLYAHVESISGKNLLYLLRLPDAEARFRHSIEIEEQTGGKTDNQRLVVPLYNLGMTLAEQGRHDEAAAAYERSIALLAQNLPKSDSRFWEMNLSLADTELAQGKSRAAFARVEPLLKDKEARDTFPLIEFVTAKALVALHRDPKRARALAVSALDRFAKEDPRKSPRSERRLAEMRAWLDQRPAS